MAKPLQYPCQGNPKIGHRELDMTKKWSAKAAHFMQEELQLLATFLYPHEAYIFLF